MGQASLKSGRPLLGISPEGPFFLDNLGNVYNGSLDWVDLGSHVDNLPGEIVANILLHAPVMNNIQSLEE